MAKEIDNLRMIQEESKTIILNAILIMCIVECDEMAKLQKQLKAEQEQNNIMAQEIDILRTRQGVECKDVEVQFSYLQPVSGTITLHHCNGM